MRAATFRTTILALSPALLPSQAKEWCVRIHPECMHVRAKLWEPLKSPSNAVLNTFQSHVNRSRMGSVSQKGIRIECFVLPNSLAFPLAAADIGAFYG